MNLNAKINEFTQIGPVFEVPGRTVNLVHNHAGSNPGLEHSEHFGKHRATTLCGSFALFKALNDLEVAPDSIAFNGVCLLLERYALLSLTGCGNPHVRKEFSQMFWR